MKRLRRIIFNSLALLSLLLCIAVAALWVRSYSVGDQLYRSRWIVVVPPGKPIAEMHETAIFLISGRGGLAVEIRLQDDAPSPHKAIGLTVTKVESSWRRHVPPEYPQASGADTLLRRLGFGHWVDHYGNGYSGSSRRIWAPDWFITLLFGSWPAVWIVRRLRPRRASAAFCPVCSYDLRATPERCPECGTVPAKVKG